MEDESSPLERLADLTPAQRERMLVQEARKLGISPLKLKAMLHGQWRFVGRPKQQAPPGDWTFWFLRCGRGFGKTLSAAQWTKKKALASPGARGALVAPTQGDVRRTMVEGVTGMLSVLPPEALFGQSPEYAWNKTALELTLANGTMLTGFSSEQPDRLRGPQHDFAWCEEVSSWKDANREQNDVQRPTTWFNTKAGLRRGEHPQAVITSTPKANRLTKELVAMPSGVLVMVVGSSLENRGNLPESYWQAVIVPLLGTALARQEIEAELLEDVEGALWSKALIEVGRVEEAPALSRIIVGVDPNTSTGEAANDAGVVVAGVGQSDNHGYVLADRTVVKGGPAIWARAAVDAYHEYDADMIVAEANNGGDMVRLVIKAADPTVPVQIVHASRGKRTRAEPVATLYERKAEGTNEPAPIVHHVGPFPELEDEMTLWTPDEESPNRMDALVWAITKLGLWAAPRKATRTGVARGRIRGVAPTGR